jgi:hypothetical protein
MSKHVHVPPRQNAMPMESHSDGQRVGYFSSTLWTRLSSLDFGEPPLFVRTPKLLQGNTYM